MDNSIKYISKNVKNIENSREIADIAKKRDIQFPSEHLGFFKTIFCEIEKPNLNGIRLSKKAIEKGLPSLIGCQCNFAHLQAGFICGAVIDAWVNDNNEIEIVYSFYKQIYTDEYEQSIELAEEGKLSVSFELLSIAASQQKLADDTTIVNDLTFIGVAHLMDIDPACPIAKISEYASIIKNRERTCDEILSDNNDETKKPALTESNIDSDKNAIKENDIVNKTIEEGGNTKMELTKEQKAEIEKLRTELGELANDVSDEELLDETIVAELRTKSEEAKKIQMAYQVDIVEVRTYSLVEKDGVDTIKETIETVKRVDYNSMLAAVAKVEELEATLAAKDSEIESVRENAEKVGKAKVELKDNTYAADFTDEDYLDDAKVEKAIQDKANAEIIASRKEELKDNKYVADFTDEDYLDETKIELATVKAKNDELAAKVPEEEVVATVKDEETTTMVTGAKTDEDANENPVESVFASIRKQNKDAREGQKVYKK